MACLQIDILLAFHPRHQSGAFCLESGSAAFLLYTTPLRKVDIVYLVWREDQHRGERCSGAGCMQLLPSYQHTPLQARDPTTWPWFAKSAGKLSPSPRNLG